MQTFDESCDVLVIGGGTAGMIAAIQAARAGAKTLLVEVHGQLGGTMTLGGVAAPAYFFLGDRQIIRGIGWELVVKTTDMDGRSLPDFNNLHPRRPSYPVVVNPNVFSLVAEEACIQSGVKIHYYEFPYEIEAGEAGWLVTTLGHGVYRQIKAKEIIDCTGGAEVVGMLGLSRMQGDDRQPGTLMFAFGGFDADELDENAIEEKYQFALYKGWLAPGNFCYSRKPFIDFLRNRGMNQQHIMGADSSTAFTQSNANIKGRLSLLRLLRFVRSLPGCEKARLRTMCPMTAVRETFRIEGESLVTYRDYMSGILYDDALAYTMYYIDLHDQEGTSHEYLDKGVLPSLPFGALIPRGSKRLLVAGRSISSDRLTNSALSCQASCMAMGQVVGAAAALGAKNGVPSRDVPRDDIRNLLRKHEAIVPPDEPRPLNEA